MKKNWKRLVLVLTMVLGLTLGLVLGLNRLSVVSKADETTTTVELTVTYGQTEARSMLDMINDFRTGDEAWFWNSDNETTTVCEDLQELVIDCDLEAVAMQRAAEIALAYGHTRPNGEECFTAYAEYGYTYRSAGENIAVGFETAEEVFTAWQEAGYYYSGQGHRRNMLNSSYDVVGIGHVVYNGIHFWVQDFAKSDTTVNATLTEANDGEATVSIQVLDSAVTSVDLVANPTSYTLSCGESSNLPSLTAALKLSSSVTTANVTVSTTWVSANDEVAVVSDSGAAAVSDDDADTASSSGMVSAVSVGSTTLSASVLGTSATVPVEVNHNYETVVTEPTCT